MAMMTGRPLLVTGSTDGIGLHTAKRLAAEGRSVYVHGRNPARLDKAVEQVKHAARDPSLITGFLADFSSLEEVRKLSRQVKAQLGGGKLGVLVNNAGVYELKRSVSADGFEMTWAVNVAAPYLLTSLLLDSVESRIVNVASISAGSSIDFSDLQLERSFSAHKSYSLSKLCNIIFNRQLAKKLQAAGSSVTANSLDPGTVNTKMLLSGWGPCGIPVKDANDEHFLATSDSLNGVTGEYFVSRRMRSPPSVAQDASVQDRLWRVLQEQTGAEWAI